MIANHTWLFLPVVAATVIQIPISHLGQTTTSLDQIDNGTHSQLASSMLLNRQKSDHHLVLQH
jgi:hypothetical protein